MGGMQEYTIFHLTSEVYIIHRGGEERVTSFPFIHPTHLPTHSHVIIIIIIYMP